MAKTVNGRERVWQIQELIGSGDAGEVLRVTSQPGNLQGVMKRPLQNVSGGTIVRQASQIETEGKILNALGGLDYSKNGLTIHTPTLLDQSIEGTSKTAYLFIVSEEIQGLSINSLLAARHESGEAIPQNVLVKVLSSTLLLLQQAHSKGVVWNDVKMDHIFWDQNSNTMSFIDWGNGLFHQPQPDLKNSPIWQDYQQLFDEGRNLLDQTSPHLVQDLGLPVSVTDLDLQDIKQLQMRVEYLETYLSMRATEYGLLFQRFSRAFADNDALRQTLELRKELNGLGIKVSSDGIFSSAQALLLSFVKNNQPAEVQELFVLLNKYLAIKIPDGWKLAEYVLNSKLSLNTQSLEELISFILDNNWVEAVWLSRRLIADGKDASILGQAIYAMRKMYDGSESSQTVYAEMLAFAGILNVQVNLLNQSADPSARLLSEKISQIEVALRNLASHWAQLPENEALGAKFLSLKQLLSNASAIHLKIPANLNNQLQKAMILIREIYQCWNSAELEGCQKAIRKFYITEPTLDYLLLFADALCEMQEKISQFENGPGKDQTLTEFAQDLYDYQSSITTHINLTQWQNTYNALLLAMINALSLDTLRQQAEAQNWPTQWLYQGNLRLRLSVRKIEGLQLSTEQLDVLKVFYFELKQKEPANVSLEAIRKQLPAWYGSYKELAEEFLFAFSSIPRESTLSSLDEFPQQDHQCVTEAHEVLDRINRWKTTAEAGDWFLLSELSATFSNDWLVLKDMKKTTRQWNNEILPALTELKQRRINSARYKRILNPHFPALSEAQSHLFSFSTLWQKIEYQGLFPQLLNDLSYHLDQAQASFFRFWQEIPRFNSPSLTWLAQQQQSVFSEINQTLLTLLRSVRSLLRNFDVINETSMARTRLAQNSAGDLVFTLTRVDELLHPGKKDVSVFKRWQRQYLDLLSTPDRTKIREGIREIESIHPLLPWFDELVKRDAGYFDQPIS